MSNDSPFLKSLKRLERAVGTLENAASRLNSTERSDAAKDAEIMLLTQDRARLAEELDAHNARTAALENANHEVVRRLDVAIDTIRNVLSTRN